MPKGSDALTNARKEEIIDACAALYETMGFRDITIRDIGAKTSFTRTSIYNYFQTKEEIFRPCFSGNMRRGARTWMRSPGRMPRSLLQNLRTHWPTPWRNAAVC